VSLPYLSLTDADREAMLAAVGVSSVEELFRDIPAGVRFQADLALEPALSEPELVAHLTELAGRNVPAGEELSFLGAGIYDHYVPAIVDAVLARGEFLTAYTPYQPEMSQGVLQAIFEYQTAICELTGMDVSNASGYDGTTVAADACYVARHITGRSKVVLCETLHPQVRQVVKTYAPGFGLEVVELPHRHGVTDPDDVREAAVDAACVLFQQPNFFGCLEPAPDLATAANEAEALPVAHVDPVSLGVLEAPGSYGCALAIGEGQGAGNYMAYGGPHYGFISARSDFIRRMPGRIVGETTDTAGRRGYVLTLQTREQHIRREKATSNITTNQTLLALAGLVQLSWLGPQGLRDVGETCMALGEYAKERLWLELVFPEQATFKEFAVRVGRSAQDVVRAARERGVHPGYALGRDYEGLDDALLVAVTEKRTPEEIDRLAAVLAEVAS
jgi:glycine dehydrogenase subunit 1